MNKYWAGVVIVGFGVAMSAMATETFDIENECADPLTCIQITGPFTKGVSHIGGKKYTATGAESTCCQLASDIQTQACNDGNEAKGAKVTCN